MFIKMKEGDKYSLVNMSQAIQIKETEKGTKVIFGNGEYIETSTPFIEIEIQLSSFFEIK